MPVIQARDKSAIILQSELTDLQLWGERLLKFEFRPFRKDKTMATQASQPLVIGPRTEKLDILFSQSANAKLEAAAAILNCSLREFVMESALTKADETIAKAHHCPQCGKLSCGPGCF